MDRKVRIERTFFLGQFKNIKVEDEINGIPEHLALNEEFVNSLYYLLLISVELTYRKYQKLNLELPDNLEDSLAVLENMKGSTIETIKRLIKDSSNEKPNKEK
jgi:hypothetical protein